MSHDTKFIEEMKQKLFAERTMLQASLAAHATKQHGAFEATFPDYGRNNEENATEIADYAAQSGTTEIEEARLKEVEQALQRIEEGTYGTTATGEPIPEARLRANPAATTLVS